MRRIPQIIDILSGVGYNVNTFYPVREPSATTLWSLMKGSLDQPIQLWVCH